MELSLPRIHLRRLLPAALAHVPAPAAGMSGIAALLGCLWLHRQQSLLPRPVALAALVLALLAVGVLSGRKGVAVRWLGLVAIGVAFAMNAQWRAAGLLEQRLDEADEGRALHIVGIVEQLPIAFERGLGFVFLIERCDPDAVRCVPGSRYRLSWYRSPDMPGSALRPGQRWELRIHARRVHGLHNPGQFDSELRALEDGIAATGSVRSGRLHAAQPGALQRLWSAPLTLVEQIRARIRQALLQAAHGANPVAAGVSIALAIGDQSAIGGAQWDLFNRTGVGHLMSISGLHITMLAGIGAFLAGRLWRAGFAARLLGRSPSSLLMRPLAQRIAAVGVAFAYSALAGWGVPAQRTCWMLLAAALAGLWGRAGSPLGVVAFALLPVLWFDPWACASAGFWLSFCAVAAIIWYCDRTVHRRSRWHGIAESIRAQYAVSVALIPLGALYFASTSLLGPIANAFAIPLVSFVVTPMSLLAAALALISPTLAGWLLWLPLTLTELLMRALVWLDERTTVQALPAPDLPALLCCAAGMVLLLSRVLPGRAVAWLTLAPLLLKPVMRPPAGEIWLTAFDVGQGMAVLVETRDGRLLYDAGPGTGGDSDAGSRVLTPYLRARGIERLDMVVLSHQDRDHIGGARSVLRNFEVPQLRSSLSDDDVLHKRARQLGARVAPCRRGDSWQWGEARFEWLHPVAQPPGPRDDAATQTAAVATQPDGVATQPDGAATRPDGAATRPDAEADRAVNARSCVLRVEGPGGSVLLAGDIGVAQEKRLISELGAARLRSTVLVAPHHGGQGASSAGFLSAVAPEYAIFQVGYRNRFRHPHPKVWARYEQGGATLLRTDLDGAITIRLSAGETPVVGRSRWDAPRYWRECLEPSRGRDRDPACPRSQSQ